MPKSVTPRISRHRTYIHVYIVRIYIYNTHWRTVEKNVLCDRRKQNVEEIEKNTFEMKYIYIILDY